MRYMLFAVLLVAMTGCGPDTKPEDQPASPAEAPEGSDEPSAKAVVPMVNSIGMYFVSIPAGTFSMGEGKNAHEVTLTKPFELGVYEVTQEQYEKVMGTNPSRFKGSQNPVDWVNWDDAVEFCRRLSELPEESATGYVYQLPTEAEWEYACRAGTKQVNPLALAETASTPGTLNGSDKPAAESARAVEPAVNVAVKVISVPVRRFTEVEAKLVYNVQLVNTQTTMHSSVDRISGSGDYAWYAENSGEVSHPVGQKKPNPWGLYGMYDNAYEWCQDRFSDYPKSVVTDPQGPASGICRVLRGGAFSSHSSSDRSVNRYDLQPDFRNFYIGFRVARKPLLSP